ncbi:MAG: nodulation protein NfeD [Wenzhouxiangella sp.]|jgi:membrane-bound serine protease (ClpP class)|nr:nodulation protein NfeD [Wenzhouxiangella sp.]
MNRTENPRIRVPVAGRWLTAFAVLFLALASIAQSPPPDASGQGAPVVHVLAVDGAIGPATRDYIVRGIEEAEAAGAALVVLQLDTPGGLDASMRDIIKKILNARVPVATWVGPPGARAASAGTYMLYASHVAAMAPSTNLGAATPVQIGGGGGGDEQPGSPVERAREALDEPSAEEAGGNAEEGSATSGDQGGEATAESQLPREEQAPRSGDAMTRKAVEDAVAYIRGLAERHGRNADWAERAVREAVSLTASDAAEMNVIDLVSPDIPALLEAIDGREVRMASGPLALATAGAGIVEKEPDWRNRFLSVLTNPTLAYILLMVGIYGLILEGYNPGALVPGVIGGICLLLALYAFQILPVNYVGLALMLLGFALIAVELFVPSLGILGIGGVVAVVVGSVILMDSDVPGMGINTGLIAAMGLVSALLFLVIVYLAAKAFRRPQVAGREALPGHRAEAISDFHDGEGRVHLEGEDWSAESEHPIAKGQEVEIIDVDGLVLKVRPIESSEGATP